MGKKRFRDEQIVQGNFAHWKQDDNQERPHSALHDQTPAVFSAGWEAPGDRREKGVEMLEVLP
jgi:transposase InsO family protein